MRHASAGRAVQGSRSAFLTPTTGLAEIVEALLISLQDRDLRLNTSVSQVRRAAQGFEVQLGTGEVLHADGLILATPAFVSASLLTEADAELASALARIPYASTATVSLAYRTSDLPRPLDGYGYVIPRREGRQALACTWTSTKFPHRAPEGCALLRVFVGRAGQDLPWTESELLSLARRELELTLGITASPLFHRVFMWENAMPQYNLGHPALLKAIESRLESHPRLALAGNGYRGIGIPDCIHSGELAVERVLAADQSEDRLRASARFVLSDLSAS
jgi:oxygen-dependent protoporphyrinogen oxidase